MSGISPPGSKLDASQIIRRAYDDVNNKIRVDAEVTAVIGSVEVTIDAAGGDNIAISNEVGSNYLNINPDGSIDVNANIELDQATDSIAIGDGTNLIDINPDGSINVVVAESALTEKNVFDEVTGIVSGITTEIISYTAITDTKLISCNFSGTNIAMYSLYIDGNLCAKKYTCWCSLNEQFNFENGLPINSGDIVSLEVVHNRPDPGNFNANLLIMN